MDLPESIVASVGIVSTIAGAVTLFRREPSKVPMDPLPPGAIEAIRKLSESSEAVKIHLAELARDVDHMQGDLRVLSKRLDTDHRTIKLLWDAMVSWGKMDSLKELKSRQEKSATETDTLDPQ